MNVLDRPEGLLPQLEFDCDVELLEPCVQMTLKSVWFAEVDGVHLRLVLGCVLDMIPQKLTEPSELGLSDVLLAKGKCLHRRLLIHDFKSCIVLEYLQHRSVSLPEELQPRCDDSSIRAIFGLLA